MTKLQELIKQKFEKGGLSRLAEIVGESAGNVSRWASKHRSIPRTKLKPVADALGVTTDYLLGSGIARARPPCCRPALPLARSDAAQAA